MLTNSLAEEDFTCQELWKLVQKDVREVESEDSCLACSDYSWKHQQIQATDPKNGRISSVHQVKYRVGEITAQDYRTQKDHFFVTIYAFVKSRRLRIQKS